MGRHMNTVGTDRDLGSVRGWSDFHGDSSVGRAAVEHGAGLCGPSRVPAACGAACLSLRHGCR